EPFPWRGRPVRRECGTSGRVYGRRWWRRGAWRRARGGRSPAPACRRCNWSAWHRAGRKRQSPERRSAPASLAPELDRERRATELPRFPKAVVQVARVRRGDGFGPVRDDGKAWRRGADVCGIEPPHRFADRLRRLLAREQRFQDAIDLGRGHALFALIRHGQDGIEQLRNALTRLGRDVKEWNELEEWRARLDVSFAVSR